MSKYEATPPSREKTLDRMAGIVRIGHDTQEKIHEKLLESIGKVIGFGYTPTDEKDKILYQYQPENQKDFYRYMMPIISSSSVIEPLIGKMKTDMYKLQNLIPIEPDPLTPTPPALAEKEKKDSGGIIHKIFGKKKVETKSTDPYDIMLPSIRRELLVLYRMELFVEYQSYGVKMSTWRTKTWMTRYKNFHFNRFQFWVATPLIRMHRQYIDLQLSTEKKHAVMIASSVNKEIFQTRNDFSMNQQLPR